MMRPRFLPGLVFGLLIGLPAGAFLTVLLRPNGGDRRSEPPYAEQLARQLEAAQRENELLTRQLGEVRGLSERLSASFADLERRFEAMEQEVRLGARPEVAGATEPPAATPTSSAAVEPAP